MDLIQGRAETELCATFRAHGAITPGTARRGKDLPLETPQFKSLLNRGIIREGAPGTFYLYETKTEYRPFVRQAVFWFFVILLPVAFLQFCAGPH